MISKSLSRNGWKQRHILAAVALTSLAIFATWNAWLDIYQIASVDEESSHIFLVPIIFAWLVWVRRGRLRQCRPVGRLIGPLIVLLGAAILIFGYNTDRQSLFHGGSLLVVIGSLIAVLGTDILLKFFPAFLVLCFMVPIPRSFRLEIAMPLQNVTAALTQQIFYIVGVESAKTGNVLVINGVQVGIAEACNGLRMVFALLLVCFAFAFGTPLRWYVRLLILAAAPLSAILCNVIRLIPTVWLYGYVSNQTVADRFHDISGWVMLGVAFLLLMAIVRTLQWALLPVYRYTLAND